jgi:hypothetical protein
MSGSQEAGATSVNPNPPRLPKVTDKTFGRLLRVSAPGSLAHDRPIPPPLVGSATLSASHRLPTSESIRRSIGYALIIQTIGLNPSGAVWTDEASNVSRLDRSGAAQADAEHPSSNRMVVGSNPSSGSTTSTQSASDLVTDPRGSDVHHQPVDHHIPAAAERRRHRGVAYIGGGHDLYGPTLDVQVARLQQQLVGVALAAVLR